MMATFGAKLRALRTQAGLTQNQVCDGIPEVSQTILSALENRVLAPQEETLEIFNDYYGVSSSYWYDGKFGTISPNEDVLIKLLRRGRFDKAIKLIELIGALEAIKAEEEVE